MKKLKLKLFAAVLSAIAVALLSGCAAVVVGAAAGGAGAAIWKNGELSNRQYADYERTWNAAVGAMTDLNYAIVDKQKDPVTGKITARAPGDKKIQVTVRKVTGTTSDVIIRVGTWGDQAQSKDILAAIQRRI